MYVYGYQIQEHKSVHPKILIRYTLSSASPLQTISYISHSTTLWICDNKNNIIQIQTHATKDTRQKEDDNQCNYANTMMTICVWMMSTVNSLTRVQVACSIDCVLSVYTINCKELKHTLSVERNIIDAGQWT